MPERLYVLDADLRLCPAGIAGELYVGGAGLGRGYLTGQTLQLHHLSKILFSEDEKDRLYKTGDLVKLLDDGQYRIRWQNWRPGKIRGYRIELERLKLCWNKAQAWKTALLRKWKHGEKRLVGYIVGEESLTRKQR